MVAPSAPEGGWRKWFLEHPYQRTRCAVVRSGDWTAAYQSEDVTPTSTVNYNVVELWFDPSDGRIYASLNGQSPDWLWFGGAAPESQWDDGVRDLFDHVLREPPPPPEPVGSGWDDFDWSQ